MEKITHYFMITAITLGTLGCVPEDESEDVQVKPLIDLPQWEPIVYPDLPDDFGSRTFLNSFNCEDGTDFIVHSDELDKLGQTIESVGYRIHRPLFSLWTQEEDETTLVPISSEELNSKIDAYLEKANEILKICGSTIHITALHRISGSIEMVEKIKSTRGQKGDQCVDFSERQLQIEELEKNLKTYEISNKTRVKHEKDLYEEIRQFNRDCDFWVDSDLRKLIQDKEAASLKTIFHLDTQIFVSDILMPAQRELESLGLRFLPVTPYSKTPNPDESDLNPIRVKLQNTLSIIRWDIETNEQVGINLAAAEVISALQNYLKVIMHGKSETYTLKTQFENSNINTLHPVYLAERLLKKEELVRVLLDLIDADKNSIKESLAEPSEALIVKSIDRLEANLEQNFGYRLKRVGDTAVTDQEYLNQFQRLTRDNFKFTNPMVAEFKIIQLISRYRELIEVSSTSTWGAKQEYIDNLKIMKDGYIKMQSQVHQEGVTHSAEEIISNVVEGHDSISLRSYNGILLYRNFQDFL